MTQWQRLPREVGDSPSLGVFQDRRDVAPGGTVSRHGGLGLHLGILDVFSNLNDSMTLRLAAATPRVAAECWWLFTCDVLPCAQGIQQWHKTSAEPSGRDSGFIRSSY